MKVFLSEASVFSGPDDWLSQLQALLIRARRGQHELVFAQAEAVLSSRFAYTHVSPSDLEWLEFWTRVVYESDALDRTIDPGARPRHRHIEVSVCGPCDNEGYLVIHPREIGSWAEQSLHIVVENEADRAIIDCTSRIYKRKAIQAAIAARWLVFEQRGGVPEVRKRVEAIPEDRTTERLLVLVDSDKTDAAEPLPPVQQGIAIACARRGIPCHITSKREIENYAPAEVLDVVSRRPRRHAHLRRQFRIWCRLPDEQKDFVDIEAFFDKSFKPDVRSQLALLGQDDRHAFECRAGFEFRDRVLPLIEEWL